MISLSDIVAANEQLSSLKSPTAVFVGATSGIGSYTLRRFAKYTSNPTIYFVGQNAAIAEELKQQLLTINKDGSYTFLQGDISLIKNVDTICDEIKSKEKKINLLFLSPGNLANIRKDTSEKLDFLAAIIYYAPTRFIENLLPQLSAASAASEPAHVVRVLGGGLEKAIDVDDLSMRKGSTLKSRGYHTTVTTLTLDHFAQQHPEVSFVHTFPFAVKTKGQTFPGWQSYLIRFVLWMGGSWLCVSEEESAQRNLFYGTSDRFPSKSQTQAKGAKEETAIGIDGEKGSGIYLVHWNGLSKSEKENEILRKYRRDGTRDLVWRYAQEEFARIKNM